MEGRKSVSKYLRIDSLLLLGGGGQLKWTLFPFYRSSFGSETVVDGQSEVDREEEPIT